MPSLSLACEVTKLGQALLGNLTSQAWAEPSWPASYLGLLTARQSRYCTLAHACDARKYKCALHLDIEDFGVLSYPLNIRDNDRLIKTLIHIAEKRTSTMKFRNTRGYPPVNPIILLRKTIPTLWWLSTLHPMNRVDVKISSHLWNCHPSILGVYLLPVVARLDWPSRDL